MIRQAKRGFTLIELLVSVAIFSGVVVLVLAAFARSADSSIRSSAIRERTEAARSIVDRIGNDMQYVYLGKNFVTTPNDCTNGATALGINFDPDCLLVLLKYPDRSSTELVLRKYVLASADGRTAIKLEEADGCRILSNSSIDCGTLRTGVLSDVISDKFQVIDQPIFSGIDPHTAELTKTTPLMRVSVTVAPTSFTGNCATEQSSCYTISSSFVPGG